jgi:hypothetical protein
MQYQRRRSPWKPAVGSAHAIFSCGTSASGKAGPVTLA